MRFLGPNTVRSTTLALLALIGFAAAGKGATRVWAGNDANNPLWTQPGNWDGGVAPQPGDTLVFSGEPGLELFHHPFNDFEAGTTFSSIVFLNEQYVLSGESISLSDGGVISCSGTNDQSIDLPIASTGHLYLVAGSGCSIHLSGSLSGAGDLEVSGLGSVVLNGNASYTGETRVLGGHLVLDGAVLSATNSVIVQTDDGTTRLEGSGSFTAPLTAAATPSGGKVVVAPMGILSTGAATFGLNSSLSVRLNGPAVGAEYDQLSVTGAVAIGDSTTLSVDVGFAPPYGTTFTIVRNNAGTPISGTFVGLPEGAIFYEHTTRLQISYVGGAGNDIVLTSLPEEAAPDALSVDAEGNGVLEAGELVDIAPSWTNTSGSALHLSGVTTNFSGPAVATYENPDTLGDYGTPSAGAAATCTDCYSVQITAASRPAQHWDAVLDETLSPSSVSKAWTLHVGESFPDVASSQQFYPFIENLFHHGITAGCGGGNYCPDAPVTRAQMAIFILKAEHGPSFTPAPCASTLFADVPCPGGPFVNWVNQLAGENITGGCGGGNYCPGTPVSRGQMAVFLLKGSHSGGYAPPACTATVFDDVPCPGGQFVDWINELAAQSITGGCGGGNYCAGDPVNRGQMAVFLVKTFGLVLYGP